MAQWPGRVTVYCPTVVSAMLEEVGNSVFANSRENLEVITGVVERQWVAEEVNTNS